jgi:hypothetical protein
MAPRWTRFVRGWLTAGFSVVVAAFSHVAGGGHEPGALGVVLALAFSVPLCIALSGAAAAGGHHSPLVVTPGAVDALGADHHMLMAGGAMWVAHAVAALVTVVGLRWGAHCLERLALVAGRRLARTARALSGAVVAAPAGPRLLPLVSSPARRAPPLRTIAARPLRGPPLSV